jgi:hypothetical protein
VYRSAVEKRAPSGDRRSTRALDLSPNSIPPNPPVWTGFFIVPSPAQTQEMDP